MEQKLKINWKWIINTDMFNYAGRRWLKGKTNKYKFLKLF